MINKLEPGDRQLSASSWNEMRDRINNITPSQDTVFTGNKNPFLITVKNNTGSNLDALSVVKLDTATYTRTGSVFANKGIECGTELNGVAPSSENDNVAIVQGACPSGGFIKAIASGCTPAFVYKDSNKNYEYAKPVASQTGYLKGTDEPTNIQVLWIASGMGKKEAYVCLDATGTPEPETFLIKASTNPTASDYAKGNLSYIIYSTTDSAWVPITSFSDNVEPGKVRLVVHQEDLPSTLTADYYMPYYPLEDNMGVEPNKSNVSAELFTDRCGVVPGEHVLSNKRFDYLFKYGRYAYEPVFTTQLPAQAHSGGNSGVYVTINNVQYPVSFPARNPNFYVSTLAPDVYVDDWLTVEVETNLKYPNNTVVNAVDYPIDFIENYVMFNVNGNQGWRGWVDVTTDYIPANNPSNNANIDSFMTVKKWGNGSYINSCASADAVATYYIAELPLKFYKKVKTNALI